MVESSQNYRRLGRNGHGVTHCSKSSSAFFLLIAGAFVLTLIYLYFSTSNELQSFRNDYENMNSKQLNLKNELLDANVKIEKMTKDDSDHKAKIIELEAKLQTCQKESDEKRALLVREETNRADCEGSVKELKTKLSAANSALDEKEIIVREQADKMAKMTKTIESLHAQFKANNFAPSDNGAQVSQALKETTLKAGERGRDQIVAPAKGDDNAELGSEDEKQNGGFIAPKRRPGGRVHLAEQAEKQAKLSNHKELLRAAAAANQDKQVELENLEDLEKDQAVEVGEGEEDKEIEKETGKLNKGVDGGEKGKNVNRPLVDALHGIVA